MLVEVTSLRKTLGERAVLDGVSLGIDRGEVVAVMGPSGAGKSTLLRCMNGLCTPDAGTVRVGDHVLAPGAADFGRQLQALRRRVGLVFQQWHLFANRTVVGNVIEAPIHVARVPRAAAVDRAQALLARVGLTGRAGAYPHELSGGEQQRAAIARALAMQPDVLLLDEPTSALDRARSEDLAALLRGLAADGLALCAVTHDPGFAAALGARVLTIADGRLAAAPPA